MYGLKVSIAIGWAIWGRLQRPTRIKRINRIAYSRTTQLTRNIDNRLIDMTNTLDGWAQLIYADGIAIWLNRKVRNRDDVHQASGCKVRGRFKRAYYCGYAHLELYLNRDVWAICMIGHLLSIASHKLFVLQ